MCQVNGWHISILAYSSYLNGKREQQRTMTPASPLSLKRFVLTPASTALALKLVNLVSQCMFLVLFELLFPTL